MKKILIIGIESFTGMHLSSYLIASGYDVYGTTYFRESYKNMYRCDISNKQNIKDIIQNILPEFIINLAGISFVEDMNKTLFYKINVLAVENILESIVEIKNYNPLKIILVSSATVYGNQENNILDESMMPNPINHYGISKFAMEQIAKLYFTKLNIIITRPFNYTGIFQEKHFLIPKIVSHYKENKKEIELGNINVFREFNDIGFICESYKRLLENRANSIIVNIATNRVVSLEDTIKMMNKIAGYDITVKVNPKFVRENEIIRLSGSSDYLVKLIGNIKQKELKETLKDMYND